VPERRATAILGSRCRRPRGRGALDDLIGRDSAGVVLVVVALVGLAAVGLWALSRRAPPSPGLTVTGTIEAREVDLSPKTTARIAAIRVEEGSRVRRGELVVQLEDAELVADVARLEAGVRVAQAQLGDLLAGARKEEIGEARAQVGRAEATLADLLAGARREEIQAARQVVAQAEARQRDLEAGSRAQEVEQARSAVASAEATRVWAEREYERLKSLFDRDLVAAADKDRAWQAFEVARMQERTAREQLALVLAGPRNEQVEAAKAEVRQARERLRLVEAGPRPDQVEAARADVRVARERLALIEAGPRPGQVDTVRAQLAQAEATLAQARARLADNRIEAPMDGVILRKSLEAGATAAPGAAIVTLVDPADIWLRAYIPETELGRVRIGQAARVTVDAFPGQPFEGRVMEVASGAEFTPRNVQTQKERVNLVFRLKIAIANPDGRLKPGMPADAVIATEQQ
jgi:HlyD family secretion protein